MHEVAFRLADVGEGLTEAEVVEWKVAVGDHVEEHQPVVEVETDKARVDLPAPATGTVASIAAEVGQLVEIGAVLFTIAVEGEAPAAPAAPADASAPAGSSARRVLAAPATRRLARELGVELDGLAGSGRGGRITAHDVESAAEGGEAGPGPTPASRPTASGDPEPLRGLRRGLARAMTAAWTIPHITELRETEASALVRTQRAMRARVAESGVAFGFAPLFVKLAAVALQSHPWLNATYDVEGETVTKHSTVDVGVATDTPDGLLVPVVRDAANRSVLELAREIDELGAAARARTLRPEQLSGGTFTVTNTGAYGGQLGTPMIRPPEVAIAGFGRSRDAVIAVDGEPVVRSVLPISVSVDHRVVSGAELGAFITTLEALIAEPALLVLG